MRESGNNGTAAPSVGFQALCAGLSEGDKKMMPFFSPGGLQIKLGGKCLARPRTCEHLGVR